MQNGITRLGNYRLIRPLGRGGFAEVYLGEHVHLKTQAAIKVLQTHLSESEKEGFLKEAQIIASLIHPHIVRVLEFGFENDQPYLVMDYAPSGTLRQSQPAQQPLPLPLVVSYVKQLGSALQYAHDKKIIHRDVKPENMLLRSHDELLLSDFGIALVAQSSRYQSHTANSAGTISYMAPEQLQGHPSPASDQYSLGIVVYEWICGKRPFQGSYTEVGSQHMFAVPPSLRTNMPALLPGIESVVLTALAKEPQRRFPNVQAFAHAFELACRGGGVGTGAISTATSSGSSSVPEINAHQSPSIAPTMLASSSLGTQAASQERQLRSGPEPTQVAFSSYPPPLPSTSNMPGPPPPIYPQGYPFIAPSPPIQVMMAPPPKPRKNGCCIAMTVLLVMLALAVGGTALVAGPRIMSLIKSSSITPDPADASAKIGAVLYEEQGADNWSGWSVGGEWKTLNGMLLSDGTSANQYNTNDFIWAPHQVGVDNYAVQATIQITSAAQSCYFGLIGRGNGSSLLGGSSSYTGYVAGIVSSTSYLGSASSGAIVSYFPLSGVSSSSTEPSTPQQYNLDGRPHMYRVEFMDNHIVMKIDNHAVVRIVDNVSLSGALLGLESGYCQLSVANFSVIKL